MHFDTSNRKARGGDDIPIELQKVIVLTRCDQSIARHVQRCVKEEGMTVVLEQINT